jgi:NAD-dependent deacetylase
MGDMVAVTGAGISKASGIPTFEEMGDIRDKLSREYFKANPKKFYEYLIKMKSYVDKAQPNPAHIALAEYEVPVVTMNIDGLHRKAGSKEVLEVHGNLDYVLCPKCRITKDFHVVEKSIYCEECGEIYEPNIVLYGDTIRSYSEAIDLIKSSNKLLVIGTSFYTSTVNYFMNRAQTAGLEIHVINKEAENEVPSFLRNVTVEKDI